jgi:hypothetical protein
VRPSFNIAGPCVPGEHYMLPPERRLGRVLKLMVPTPRRGGLLLACTLASILGCTGRQELAPPVLAAAARVPPGAPSDAPPLGAGSAPAAADAGEASSEGATLPAPPSPEDNNLFGLVRSAGDLAKAGSNRLASPDGARVVFVKPEGPKGKPSLWVSRKDGGDARKLVDVDTTHVEGSPGGIALGETSGIFDLSFSPDGKKVYFQTDYAATSLALLVVEIDSGKLRFVHDANGYTVIRACTDKKQIGRLIVLRHSYFDPIPTMVVDWYFLLDEKGQRLGIVGPGPDNVKRFMAKQCGVGVAPPAPPKEEVPPRLRTPRLDCGEHVIQHKPVPFLDGTGLDFFLVFDRESLKTESEPYPNVVSPGTAEAMVDFECPARKKQ